MSERATAKEQEESILALKSQLLSLQLRINDLEAENAKLFARLSTCRCNQMEEKRNGLVIQSKLSSGDCPEINGVGSEKSTRKAKSSGGDTSLMKRCRRRYVALKVMYFGQRFYGFASEAQMEPTIESEIFKALKRMRLLIGDKKEAQYSRCGRTDKGVSAVGQVIALYLRSKLKDNEARMKSPEEIVPQGQIEGEIDYPKVLNGVLPNDIRIVGWCPVPTDFHARFSCLCREYKYFFWSDNLNLTEMERAGRKFVGEHNFSNFCKMDAANVHNYKRSISSFEISPSQVRYEDNQLLCALTVKGTAFLWHQVRCMVAVLFMIGQGLEPPDVIDALLDVKRTPRKPQYHMAPELPLVLCSCEFDGLQFVCSSDARESLNVHLMNERRRCHLQAAIFHDALLDSSAVLNDQSQRGILKKKASHVPLMSRPTEPSYGERRAKLERMQPRVC